MATKKQKDLWRLANEARVATRALAAAWPANHARQAVVHAAVVINTQAKLLPEKWNPDA